MSFRGCGIGDETAKAMAAMLRPAAPLAEEEGGAGGGGGDAGGGAPVPELKGLISLQLFDNAIGDEGAAAFAAALKVNGSLKALSLGRNEVGNKAARAFAGMLTRYAMSEAEVAERHALAEAHDGGGGGKGKGKGGKGGKGGGGEPGGMPPMVEEPEGSNQWYGTGNVSLKVLDLSHNRRLGTEGGVGLIATALRDHLQRAWDAKYPPPPPPAAADAGEGEGGGEDDGSEKVPMPDAVPLVRLNLHQCGAAPEDLDAVRTVLDGTLFMPPPVAAADSPAEQEGKGEGKEEAPSGKSKRK